MNVKILTASLALALAPLAVSVPVATAMPAEKNSSPNLAATGNAFGTSIRGNSYVSSGPTAPVYMCTKGNNKRKRNFVASIGEDQPLNVRGVTNWTRRGKVNGNPSVTTVSKIAEVRLGESDLVLEGLKAKARIVSLGNGKFDRTFNTSVAKLKIQDELIVLEQLDEPREIEIPGVATLKLNMGKNFTVGKDGFGVRALGAKLQFADEDKTTARLAKASATFTPKRRDVVSGKAHALNASVLGNLVQVGRVANQPLPCAGTSGEMKENTTASLAIPGVLAVDGAFGRAYSNQKKRFTVARTEGGVAELILGDGQVVIEGLTSTAETKKLRNGKRQFSTAGSRLLSLTIDGELQEMPADGETVEIPGLARLDFGVVVQKNGGVQRTGVIVTLLNDSDVETVIPVAVASAYVR